MPRYKFIFDVQGWGDDRENVETSVIDYPNQIVIGSKIDIFGAKYFVKDIAEHIKEGFSDIIVDYRPFKKHNKFEDGLREVKVFVNSLEGVCDSSI